MSGKLSNHYYQIKALYGSFRGGGGGGLTIKIHATVNENELPLKFHPTPGQAHDAPVSKILLQGLQPNQLVIADKAYDADWIRALIYEHQGQYLQVLKNI